MAYPRYRLARHFKSAAPTAGSVLVDTTDNWENLSVFEPGFADITLHKCQPNDAIQVYLTGTWQDEAVLGDMTAITVVDDVVTNYIPSGTATPMPCRAWRGRPGVFTDFGAWSSPYIVQTGDIHNDWDVTLRLQARTNGPKTFAYDGGWMAVNFGPAQGSLS